MYGYVWGGPVNQDFPMPDDTTNNDYGSLFCGDYDYSFPDPTPKWVTISDPTVPLLTIESNNYIDSYPTTQVATLRISFKEYPETTLYKDYNFIVKMYCNINTLSWD